MIKLGVTRLEQLRQRRIQTLMGGTRYVSLRLLEELGTIPESEANQLFPVVTKRLTNSAGAFRRTDPERFDTLNAELMNFLAAHRDRVGGLRVHDAAVADGTTALALYRSFLEAGIQLDSYLATDLCDYVVQIDRGGSGPLVFLDPTTNSILQVHWQNFVFNFPKGENPFWYPVNGLVRNLLMRFPVRRLLEDWKSGEVGKGARVELLHPAVLSEVASPSVFFFRREDLFNEQSTPVDFVRAMNVLNRSYFSEAQLKRAVRSLARPLELGGYLLIGGDSEKPGETAATLFRRTDSSLVPETRWSGGAPVESLITGVELSSVGAKGTERPDCA